jgi:Na+/melibiose symporter-like transporter
MPRNSEHSDHSFLVQTDFVKEKTFGEYWDAPYFKSNLAIMTLLWVTVVFNFYLLNFYLSNMKGDINVNSLFSGLAMIIAFLLSAPIINRIGNKTSFLMFFMMCIISAGAYIVVGAKNEIFIAFLVFVTRFGLCPCYSLTFISSN